MFSEETCTDVVNRKVETIERNLLLLKSEKILGKIISLLSLEMWLLPEQDLIFQ